MSVINVGPDASAADVLKRTVPREMLQGRITLIGSSAAGLSDLRATSFDPLYPGVEIRRAAVVMADVSVKGVSAALFMMMSRTVIKNLALRGKPPHEIMSVANNELCDDNSEMFVTAFLAVFDRRKNTLTCANAGHNPPILVRGDKPEWLKADSNFVLAGLEDMTYSPNEVPFGEGDFLILYTDGVTEMMNQNQEFFGEDRLMELVTNFVDVNPSSRDIVEAINAGVLSRSPAARNRPTTSRYW